MNRIILATLCFLAVSVYAQQFGNISVATVTSGVTVTSVLPITTDEDNYDVQVYKFWVPTNASGATIQFLNTNQGDCSWLHLFLRSDGLPCSYHDYSSTDYVCANAYDPGNGVKTQTVNMYPGFDQELFFWATNQYHYIAIGRYSDYSDKACSYTFNVTVNYNCSNNQVAIGGSSSTTCVNYVAATSGAPVQQSVNQMYKIVVADNTGNVQVVVNSTSTDVYIYAANFYGPSTNSYQYYTTSYITSGNYYIYTLNCYTPRAGDFYVYVDLSSTASNNTVTITANVCGTGLGGFNCSFNATALNLTALASTSGVTVYSPSYNGWLSYGFSYFYIDVPSARLGYNSIKISASSASTGQMFIRRGGFNENSATYGYEDSNEYESFPAGFYLNNFEYGVAGRIYFGLACSSTTADCMITLSANTTNNAPVTTGMDIGVTTMAASDSASYILAPFVAAIVALVAMMF